MLVICSPGLVCAVYPALAGRQHADVLVRSFRDKFTKSIDEHRGKQSFMDWYAKMMQYIEVRQKVKELSARQSPVVQVWL